MVNVRIVLAIIALTLSILWGTADVSTPSGECAAWAAELGYPNAADERIMLDIGCDQDENGAFVRDEGVCAAIARDAFRDGLAPYYVVRVTKAKGCEHFEDGSYGNYPDSVKG